MNKSAGIYILFITVLLLASVALNLYLGFKIADLEAERIELLDRIWTLSDALQKGGQPD